MDENIIREDPDMQSDSIIPDEENISSENESVICTENNNIPNDEFVSDTDSSAQEAQEQFADNTDTDSVQQEYPNYQNAQNQSAPTNPYEQFRQQQMQYQQYPQQQGQYQQYQQQYQQYYQSPAPEPAPIKKKGSALPLTAGQKKIAWLLRIGIILTALIFVYCIVSDVVLFRFYTPDYDTPSSYDTDEKDSPVIYREGKPSSYDGYSDNTDGDRYTVKEIADMVSPSIVQIQASSTSSGGSTGSGIILTETGYILTNAHVVNGYDKITVTLYDSDETLPADVVGYDSKSDLAVLHTESDDLKPAAIGYASELSVGEEVVAIGNPAGLKGSVTKGIVSALGRQIRSGSTGFYMDCIQTDAAISPGNSGGALINMYGQVVGVTSSKYGNAYFGGTYEGLGFAISIDQALPIAEEIMTQGYVSGRVRIGITFASMTEPTIQEEFAANFNLTESPCKEGIWITDISPECDIANTELDVNDIILSVNGKKVDNYDQLQEIIKDCKADDELTAQCRRYTFGDTKDDLKHKDFTIKFKLMEDTSGDF